MSGELAEYFAPTVAWTVNLEDPAGLKGEGTFQGMMDAIGPTCVDHGH